MAAIFALRLRRVLPLTSSLHHHHRHFSSILSVSSRHSLSSSPTTVLNPNIYSNQLNPNFVRAFKSSSPARLFSSRPSYNNNRDGDEIDPNAILFEGCDYNHWLITMDFPKDPKLSPEEMVETYVQTAAKVLGSVEEAKKKIYACSTTTYEGFQVEVSEEVSEKFRGLPGVVFILPDSYIDPVNKEYGGDKYINGTIIPRPPPVQYGRSGGGRYNDRNRDYNRPPRGTMQQNPPPLPNYGATPMNNASGGQDNYQGDRRGPMPAYQGNHNQGERRTYNPPGQTDLPPRDQRNYSHPEQRDFRGDNRNYSPPQGGNYGQGAGESYGQGAGGSYGQGTRGSYGQGTAGNYGQGTGGNYGQGAGGNYGQGAGGNYGQGAGGNYRQGAGGNYRQGAVGNYGQGGQGVSGAYGQAMGSGYSQGSSQYGENTSFPQRELRNNIPGQQGNFEDIQEAGTTQGRF